MILWFIPYIYVTVFHITVPQGRWKFTTIFGNKMPGESPAALGKKTEEKWIAKSKYYDTGSLT